MSTKEQELLNDLLQLTTTIQQATQRSFGHIFSATRHCVHIPGRPDIAKKIQSEVHADVQGFLLIYLFTVWEAAVDRDVEQTHLAADDLEQLRAFRHIRHTYAHNLEGKRANQCRKEFDAVMSSGKPIRQVTWDADTIDLSESQVALDGRDLLQGLANKLIAKVGSKGSALPNP